MAHIEPNPVAAPAAATASAQVRALNDAFRCSFVGGRVMVAAGVGALPAATRAAIIALIRSSEAFSADNDPHGEHDFGAVEVEDVRCFWKIDTYDRDLQAHSPNPADPTVTVRVLTIMLAEEY